MTLTVPKAGSTAGSAAQVRLEAPQGAGAMAQFGQVMAEVGRHVEDDQLRREAQRFTVDLTRDLNDLRLEVSQIGDPDQATATWDQRSTALRQSYMDGQTDSGRPRVSQKNSDRFGLTFDQLHNQHSFSLGRQAVAARHAEYQANTLTYRHEALTQMSAADEDQRAVLAGQYSTMLGDMEAANVINAAQRAQLELAFLNDAENARAIGMVANDPQAYLDADAAGKFDAMDAEARAQRRVQAQGNLDRAASATQRAIEADQTAEVKATGNRLGDMRDVLGAGMQSEDLTFLETPQAKSHEDYSETMAALALANEQPDLGRMTLEQIDTLIAAEKARPVAKKYQTERLEFLAGLKVKVEAGYEKDAIAYAAQAGLYVPDLPEFDPNDPKAYAEGLSARIEHGQYMQDQGYTKDVVVLSEAEQEQFEELVGSDQDPASRLTMVKAMAAAYGDEAGGQSAKLAGDPVFGLAAGLIAQGLPDKTARDILSGQTKLAQKTVANPSRSQAIELFHEKTEGLFRDQPHMTEAVLGAALAIYAEENPTEDPTELDGTKFNRAVQRAMGALPGDDGQLSVGGLQTIGEIGEDHLVPLPPRMPAQQVNDALERVGDQLGWHWKSDDPNYSGGPTTGGYIQPNVDLLASASLSDQVPDLGDPGGDDYNPKDIWNDLQLAPLWPDGRQADSYVLFRMRGGRPVYLQDTSGQTFVLSLGRLLKGAAQ